MATHNETGKKGEELAVDWLVQNGFSILHRNWRHAHREVDIIAGRNGLLHFIEVKTSRSQQYGWPEQRVHAKKWQYLQTCAAAFVEQEAFKGMIRFDILAIRLLNGHPPEYFFMEDCYCWE